MLSIEYRYFFQSALDSSIRKASQNLNINSSAIVRQIQKLEDRLQTKLFIRNARGLELTDEGRMLFEHLKTQNEVNNSFLSDLRNNKTNTTGEINISTGETFAVQFLTPIISKFRKQYPLQAERLDNLEADLTTLWELPSIQKEILNEVKKK